MSELIKCRIRVLSPVGELVGVQKELKKEDFNGWSEAIRHFMEGKEDQTELPPNIKDQVLTIDLENGTRAFVNRKMTERSLILLEVVNEQK